MIRIRFRAEDLLKIDDPSLPANPNIDLPAARPDHFVLTTRGPFLRDQRAQPDPAVSAKAVDQRAHPCGDLLGTHRPQVVGADQNDTVGDSVHWKYVLRQVVKDLLDALTRDSRIHQRDPKNARSNRRPGTSLVVTGHEKPTRHTPSPATPPRSVP